MWSIKLQHLNKIPIIFSSLHNETTESIICSLVPTYDCWCKEIQFSSMAFLILSWVGSAKGLVSCVKYLLWKGCRCLSKCQLEPKTVLFVECKCRAGEQVLLHENVNLFQDIFSHKLNPCVFYVFMCADSLPTIYKMSCVWRS